ncbi:hypothetical protein HL653_10935 [Sphingomonas sp. AP4-R1]|uniref:hypothetical protein n=1 Tax=Sphingomonas sp. AP4-R1 TaxID=2735134 RepID=UPI0014936352|nr:hypothetical protein [Sphingomonas sp. AP4-R1]QJU58235.1 hypothetical protein HL653_10935 [Sphingomonas sp. AP4-R1]
MSGGKAIDFDAPITGISRAIGAKPTPMAIEQLLDEALLQAYRARTSGADRDRAVALAELLLERAPERFEGPDVYMLRLLSDVTSPRLAPAARRLLATFDLDQDRRPVSAVWSGNVLEKLGDVAAAVKLYALLCDRSGFEDEAMKAQACERVGAQEIANGQITAGRQHLWHSARISRNANDRGEFERKVALLGQVR